MQDGISTHALTEGDDHRSFRTPGRSHFNSRPHGGRPITSQNFSLSSIFQLTPSRRATDFYFTHGILLSFQLTPSRRATGHLCHGLQRHGISTHALTEGDNTALSGCTEEERFQLTPSRRATFSRMCLNQPIHISTHALTEGDCSRSGHLIFPEIFQLTPSRRATVTGRCLRLSASYFNSRPHGGRRDSDRIKDVFAYISTHALTEGDRKLHSSLPGRRNFNSRPHGGRLCPCFHQIPGRYFNSRPHGGRLMPTLSLTFFFYFNSRPHGGRLLPLSHLLILELYFNSRPHGGRPEYLGIARPTFSFQLTPSRRATDLQADGRYGFIFQLTPSRRATSAGNGRFF